MKQTRFLLFIFFYIITSIYAFGQVDEKAKIIKVIEDEHKFASEKKFEQLANTFAHSENLLFGNGIQWGMKGWENLSKGYKEHFTNNPEPGEADVFDNYDITISDSGDKAWATFDHKKKGSNQVIAKELRILIKEKGVWKISSLQFLYVGS